MNGRMLGIAALVSAGVLVTGTVTLMSLPAAVAGPDVTMPTNAAEYASEAARYQQEASTLEASARRHADMAAHYKHRASGGGKQATSLGSLASHCEKLAKAYATAAAEAREMAKSLQEMSTAG
ncbi:MAG: hypothetical protein KDI87_00120 [Gammaproteobacteria bacterium]|nr:hypothetical protein [Gammaproteobacteria bacterium]MCP5138493.1 hypothetical protein [Chromatiales bacterium]